MDLIRFGFIQMRCYCMDVIIAILFQIEMQLQTYGKVSREWVLTLLVQLI